jgi:uncharacterized membrane protein YheB (UPF0754 family)
MESEAVQAALSDITSEYSHKTKLITEFLATVEEKYAKVLKENEELRAQNDSLVAANGSLVGSLWALINCAKHLQNSTVDRYLARIEDLIQKRIQEEVIRDQKSF